jgi:subtilase family serine protease
MFAVRECLAACVAVCVQVHSLSVGIPENEFAAVIPSMNAQLMALGARGVTIVVATGDGGYSVNLNYPASSPYVLAVGGVWNGDLGTDPLEVRSSRTHPSHALIDSPLPLLGTSRLAPVCIDCVGCACLWTVGDKLLASPSLS